MNPQIPPQLNDQLLAQMIHEKQQEEQQQVQPVEAPKPPPLRDFIDQSIAGTNTTGKVVQGLGAAAMMPIAGVKAILNAKFKAGGPPFTVNV